MTKGLTERQAQVLEFINSFLHQQGYPPTVREVAARFGFRSPRAAHDHMKALQRKGYLRSAPGLPRALNVIGPPKGIPVLGRIAAGQPMLAVEEADEFLDLDPAFFGGGRFFALSVRGDSMVGDHIQEGDLVILRSQPEAPAGEVVAVLLEDEVTLKHFHPQPDGVELRSSNPEVKTIRVPAGQPLRLLGVMVGLVRRV
ncbi:MAG: repressor LexA [Desulfarculus sp.]|nr:repressor LexA [Desulfarculus sp.]